MERFRKLITLVTFVQRRCSSSSIHAGSVPLETIPQFSSVTELNESLEIITANTEGVALMNRYLQEQTFVKPTVESYVIYVFSLLKVKEFKEAIKTMKMMEMRMAGEDVAMKVFVAFVDAWNGFDKKIDLSKKEFDDLKLFFKEYVAPYVIIHKNKFPIETAKSLLKFTKFYSEFQIILSSYADHLLEKQNLLDFQILFIWDSLHKTYLQRMKQGDLLEIRSFIWKLLLNCYLNESSMLKIIVNNQILTLLEIFTSHHQYVTVWQIFQLVVKSKFTLESKCLTLILSSLVVCGETTLDFVLFYQFIALLKTLNYSVTLEDKHLILRGYLKSINLKGENQGKIQISSNSSRLIFQEPSLMSTRIIPKNLTETELENRTNSVINAIVSIFTSLSYHGSKLVSMNTIGWETILFLYSYPFNVPEECLNKLTSAMIHSQILDLKSLLLTPNFAIDSKFKLQPLIKFLVSVDIHESTSKIVSSLSIADQLRDKLYSSAFVPALAVYIFQIMIVENISFSEQPKLWKRIIYLPYSTWSNWIQNIQPNLFSYGEAKLFAQLKKSSSVYASSPNQKNCMSEYSLNFKSSSENSPKYVFLREFPKESLQLARKWTSIFEFQKLLDDLILNYPNKD